MATYDHNTDASWIALANPKSPENVGLVMRAAGCFGVRGVFYSGQRYHRARQFITDTKDMHEQIPLTWSEDLFAALPPDTVPVAVELVEGAIALPEFVHPPRAFYVFGPEDSSLTQAQVNQCRQVIYIPTTGCLNLSASVNVVLYDRLSKSAQREQGDDLIRRSRDTNNRLRWRRD
jgi:tRNA(Leu) C34 or U34 (ribose-2'-O)-methylase TrmL